MAKLGEARLGSTQFAQPAEFEIDTYEARERAEETIKSVYPTEPGTTWDKVLDTVLYEHEIQTEVIEDIASSRFIDEADQAQLGFFGSYFGVSRRAGESDEAFRARIKLQFPRHTSRATLDQIIDAAATILKTEKERLTVIEPHAPQSVAEFDDETVPVDFDEEMWGWFKWVEGLQSGWTTTEQESWITDTLGESLPGDWEDDSAWTYRQRDRWVRVRWEDWVDPNYSGLPTDWGTMEYEEQVGWIQDEWLAYRSETDFSEPARFDIHVEDIVFDEASITIDEFEHLIQDVRAGGVKATATIGNQFTHRSVEDFNNGTNDPDRAYGGYDPETVDWPAGAGPDTPPTSEPGSLTESSILLETGAPYADEITRQLT